MVNLGVKPNVLIRMGEDLSLYKNNVVQGGIEWILDSLISDTVQNLTHIAVGNSSAQVSLGDVKLGNELVRKAIATRTREIGILILESFFDTTEANFNWLEIGLYSQGTSVKDSGILVARAVVNEYKDSLRTAIVSWDIGLQNM